MPIKVSIITATYNSEKTLRDTINSVLSQSYKNIEYIIIDGGSIDGTMDIIRAYGSSISKIISEPDRGIYDAMNKGIEMATGDIVGILNSDDLYNDEQVLSEVVNAFESDKVDAIYGNLVYVDKRDTNKIIRYWESKSYIAGDFCMGWHPPHPSFFVRKEIYEKYGLFDCSLDISADFELMLRFIEKNKIETKHISKVLVKMRLGGESNRSLKNIIQANINCVKAFKKNGIKTSIFYPIVRLLPKIKQFLISGRIRGA